MSSINNVWLLTESRQNQNNQVLPTSRALSSRGVTIDGTIDLSRQLLCRQYFIDSPFQNDQQYRQHVLTIDSIDNLKKSVVNLNVKSKIYTQTRIFTFGKYWKRLTANNLEKATGKHEFSFLLLKVTSYKMATSTSTAASLDHYNQAKSIKHWFSSKLFLFPLFINYRNSYRNSTLQQTIAIAIVPCNRLLLSQQSLGGQQSPLMERASRAKSCGSRTGLT